MAVQCSDPDQGGKPTRVTVSLSSGSTLGPSNYGLWKAGETAQDSCHWAVVKGGEIISKGGRHDSLLSGTAAKGGVLTATNCGTFHK